MERLGDKLIIAAGCFVVAMGMGMDVPEIGSAALRSDVYLSV